MFIVIEGVDGCGKSTQAKLIADWIEASGREVFLTAEPTRGRIGRFLREILGGKTQVDPKTLALLFTADRMEHLENEVEPALKKGIIVVSERYYHSTVCYQAAQGVDLDWLLKLNEYARKPEHVFLIDVDPKESLTRKKAEEIFEEKEFLAKVRENYLKLDGMTMIDGSESAEKVFRSIKEKIKL